MFNDLSKYNILRIVFEVSIGVVSRNLTIKIIISICCKGFNGGFMGKTKKKHGIISHVEIYTGDLEKKT